MPIRPWPLPTRPSRSYDEPAYSPPVPSNRPVSVPPPPPPGITPIVPVQRPSASLESDEPFRATLTNAAINSARAERRRPTLIPQRPVTKPEPVESVRALAGHYPGRTLFAPWRRAAHFPTRSAQSPPMRRGGFENERAAIA